MPIYEYACRKCNAHIEILQKLADKPLTRCKKCGGKLEKQWSAPGIQFKGSGWYVTDYAGRKSDAKDKETKSDAKAEKSDTKSETKTSDASAKPKAKPTSTDTSGD